MTEHTSWESEASPERELKIVRAMIEKTRQGVVDRGSVFILWGVVVMLACGGTFWLESLERHAQTWLLWAILLPIGAIGSLFLMRRYTRRTRHKSFLEHAYNSIWLACGLAFFAFIFSNAISAFIAPDITYVIVSFLVGIAVFASGSILDWVSLRIGGAAWWLGGVVMMFVATNYHPLIMALAIIPGMLVPGLLLKRAFSSVGPKEPVTN